jgi:hypothetical protein
MPELDIEAYAAFEAKAQETFEKYDVDKSGNIDKDELKALMTDLGMNKGLNEEQFDREVENELNASDFGAADGKLDYDEFVALYNELINYRLELTNDREWACLCPGGLCLSLLLPHVLCPQTATPPPPFLSPLPFPFPFTPAAAPAPANPWRPSQVSDFKISRTETPEKGFAAGTTYMFAVDLGHMNEFDDFDFDFYHKVVKKKGHHHKEEDEAEKYDGVVTKIITKGDNPVRRVCFNW